MAKRAAGFLLDSCRVAGPRAVTCSAITQKWLLGWTARGRPFPPPAFTCGPWGRCFPRVARQCRPVRRPREVCEHATFVQMGTFRIRRCGIRRIGEANSPTGSFRAQAVKQLPEAPRGYRATPSVNAAITSASRRLGMNRRLVVRCQRQPHRQTGPLHRRLVFTDEHLVDLSVGERPHGFRLRTSLIAVFERLVRVQPFSLAFSTSSSRSHFTFDIEASPYLLRRLKNLVLLTPC